MEACQGKVDWSIRRKTTNHTGRQSSGGFLRWNDWFSVAVCVSGKMIWATKLKSHCQRLLHCYGVSDCSWRACIYLCTGGSSSNQSERAHPRHGQWIGASCVMCTVSDWVQNLVDCWPGSLEYLFTVAKFVTHTETIGIFFLTWRLALLKTVLWGHYTPAMFCSLCRISPCDYQGSHVESLYHLHDPLRKHLASPSCFLSWQQFDQIHWLSSAGTRV